MNRAVSTFFFAQAGRSGRRFGRNTTQYFSKPIVEGQFKVLPPLPVPSHIARPDYVNSPSPVFGIYEGAPVKHNEAMIVKMRKAAKVASIAAQAAAQAVKEGMTTDDIDKIVHQSIISQGAYPSPIGFMGFPKSVCTSVNEVVCHGIPNLRPLENGDSLNIDVTCYVDGVHGDTSVMACVGEEPDRYYIAVQALYEAIKICRPGVKFSKIGEVIEEIASEKGFVVCDIFTGHGIGNLMHMPPTIMHHTNNYPGEMEKGNLFTIEPILMVKPSSYVMWDDKFTVVSQNNPSAQWEHMILITENGYEVLTKRENEII